MNSEIFAKKTFFSSYYFHLRNVFLKNEVIDQVFVYELNLNVPRVIDKNVHKTLKYPSLTIVTRM